MYNEWINGEDMYISGWMISLVVSEFDIKHSLGAPYLVNERNSK